VAAVGAFATEPKLKLNANWNLAQKKKLCIGVDPSDEEKKKRVRRAAGRPS
jgi:hypothetical protein